jgi:hypothetical protein
VTIPCKVWKTRADAVKGMSTEAMKAVTKGMTAIVVTFFPNRHQECKSFFVQNGIPHSDLSTDDLPGGPSIILLPATKLDSYRRTDQKQPVLLFYGPSPLPGREEMISERIVPVSQCCCASLDDPFFKAFGMEKVVTLMETLGMQNDESIEHAFVDKAIRSAQEKLGKKVKNEIKSETEEEWFQKNIAGKI